MFGGRGCGLVKERQKSVARIRGAKKGVEPGG